MGKSKRGEKLPSRPGYPDWTSAVSSTVKPHSKRKSKSEELSELVPGATRDPRLCSRKAKQRWTRGEDDCPEEMYGLPKLDDNGRPMYRECRGTAVAGTDCCMAHGGSLPNIKKKAERLLEESRDVLMAALIDMALDETKDDNLRLRAIQWGLERSGFGPGVKIDLSLAPWQEMLQKFAGEIEAEEGH